MDSDNIKEHAMLEIGLQMFCMAIAAPYLEIALSFATLFPRLMCIRWIRGLCKPWNNHELAMLAQFHTCCQPYLLQIMHALRMVESIKISFEENFAISSCETDYFEALFAHLRSVDL